MAQIRAWALGVDVRQQTQDTRHRSRDRDLAGAQQRDIGDAHLASGVGRELREQIWCGREDNADEVVGGELVARQHLGEELRRRSQDLVALISVDLDRSTYRSRGDSTHLLVLDQTIAISPLVCL
jgi:hypothetical protein